MPNLKVISSLAVKGAYLELAPQFEKQSGHKVDTQWAGMVDIRKRVLAGEAVDAVIGSAALIEELVRSGRLAAGSRAGAPRPDLSSVEAFKRALRAAKSIVYSSGPSGVYLAELFQRLGLAEELKGKAVQAPPGVLVAEQVARGEAELCFQQLPELRQVAGIDYVGPLPAPIQLMTVFSGAARTEAGAALLKFLSDAKQAVVMAKHGFETALGT